MLKLVALALTLAACPSHTPPPAAPPAAPPAPPPVAAPPAPATRLAAVELTATWSECSGAGGEHAAFAIGGQRMHVLRMAHAGGHAEYHQFGGDRLALAGGRAASGWYVAELLMRPRPDEDHDDNPDSGVAGWCLEGMPRFAAEVVRLWPAADEADARRRASAPPATPPSYTSRWIARP